MCKACFAPAARLLWRKPLARALRLGAAPLLADEDGLVWRGQRVYGPAVHTLRIDDTLSPDDLRPGRFPYAGELHYDHGRATQPMRRDELAEALDRCGSTLEHVRTS